MGDVDRLGICEVTKQALDHVSLGGSRPVHLSFDVDSMDDFEIGSCTGTSGESNNLSILINIFDVNFFCQFPI